MTKQTKEKSAAVVTIRKAYWMTPLGRKHIADWLRRQAQALETEGKEYAATFRARYLYR